MDKLLEREYQIASISGAKTSELFALDEAYRRYLEAVLKDAPNDVQVLIQLGVLSWEPFHEDEKAIEYLAKAIALDPQNVEARFWLATCYYHDFCAYEKARTLLMEALKIDPYRPECLSLLASIVIDTTKNIGEAINLYLLAIDYAPNWPILYRSIVELYLEIGDLKQAEVYVQKGLRCQPLTTPPKNTIEEYFENIVSGRSWTHHQEKFYKLISSIQNIKK